MVAALSGLHFSKYFAREKSVRYLFFRSVSDRVCRFEDRLVGRLDPAQWRGFSLQPPVREPANGVTRTCCSKSAVLPPTTTKSRGPTQQVRATLLQHPFDEDWASRSNQGEHGPARGVRIAGQL